MDEMGWVRSRVDGFDPFDRDVPLTHQERPRHLITCARLLRAYTLLRVPGSRLKEISSQLGYAKPQTLSELFLLWTGCTSKGVRESVPPEMFVRLLTERLHRIEIVVPIA